MGKIGSWIETIIEDLVSDDKKVGTTLLKVKVLAHKLNNDELKNWVNNELEGYKVNETPKYRKIRVGVFGNLVQSSGFQTVTKNGHPLPVEYLDKEYWPMLLYADLNHRVAEIEHLAELKNDPTVNLPYGVSQMFSKMLNPWNVNEAYQRISQTSLNGVLSTIRSTLLNFMLELQTEVGESDNSRLFERKKVVSEIFNRTIGSITGEKIHISIGNDNIQATNYGKGAGMNVGKGNEVNQKITISEAESLENFLEDLRSQVPNLFSDEDEQTDVIAEIERIRNQLSRSEPKKGIIKSSLSVLYDMLIGVASNAASQPLIEVAATLLEGM